jgi:hypothetical protein
MRFLAPASFRFSANPWKWLQTGTQSEHRLDAQRHHCQRMVYMPQEVSDVARMTPSKQQVVPTWCEGLHHRFFHASANT